MDKESVRQLIARDMTLGSEIPADAEISEVRALDLEESIRLSTEYPAAFRRHKGAVLHAATISYQDEASGFWRSRVVVMTRDGKVVLFT